MVFYQRLRLVGISLIGVKTYRCKENGSVKNGCYENLATCPDIEHKDKCIFYIIGF